MIDGLRKLGAFGMKIAEEYGGLGFNQVEYTHALELIGQYDANVIAVLCAHQSIGLPQPLKLFGTEAQKKKYLPRCAKGSISAFALTEPDVGSDPARLSTTATKTPEGDYILNGEKLWCTNGTFAELFVVMARDPADQEDQHVHRRGRLGGRRGRLPLPLHGSARARERHHPLQERRASPRRT